MMDRVIKHVHFQITRNCNLRCHFCGQWGKKGFFADSKGAEMTFEDWENVINQLVQYREKSEKNICITVWGGEPLVSPYFDKIVMLLKQYDFETEVITNGVLIEKHKDVIEKYVDRLYVSLDGTKEIHDEIRGNGVYDKVVSALESIHHNNITVMSVMTQSLVDDLAAFLDSLDNLNIKKLILHDMIGLSSEEIEQYVKWLKCDFNIEAKEIYSWENNGIVKRNILYDDIHNYEILVRKHIDNNNIICKSPFNHIHITWNGNVMYCTDFYDFTSGNVRDDDLESIFLNEKSEKFRQAILNNKCVSCAHCSWRCNDNRMI